MSAEGVSSVHQDFFNFASCFYALVNKRSNQYNEHLPQGLEYARNLSPKAADTSVASSLKQSALKDKVVDLLRDRVRSTVCSVQKSFAEPS